MKILVCFVVLMLHRVSGYSAGPPSSVCGTMEPGHGKPAQTSSVPYQVTFSKNTYSPNERIEVTLSGSTPFRGFLIKPVKDNDPDPLATYGTIEDNDKPAGTRNPCFSPKTALSHDSSADKTSVKFTWTAPSSDEGEIKFYFTVVQTKNTYWVKKSSSGLTFQPSSATNAPTGGPTGSQTNAPTDPPTDPPSTAAPTTASPSSQINRDPACEDTKSCFPSTTECSTNCEYLVSWMNAGSDEVEFTLTRKTTKSNYWMAIGFSYDPQMGNDSVAACVANNGMIDVVTSYNPSYMNTVFENSNFGVTLVSQSLSDGVMTCTFRRKKNFALAESVLGRRRRAAQEGEFFDLSSEYFLLVAHGDAFQGDLRKHMEYPKWSSSKIDFLGSFVESSTPKPGEVGKLDKNPECGDTVGCYHDCEGKSCSFLLTWEDKGDDVKLSLSCTVGTNAFCAIGLSRDNKMGDDSVFQCVENNGEVKVAVSYNSGKSNQPLDQADFGLTVESTSIKNGVLTCNFMRKKTFALANVGSNRKKRATAASDSTFFNMNDDYNLLYAYGSASGGFISKHTTTPIVSSEKADFQKSMDIGGKASSKILLKLHGILMIVAWMICASTGMFVAKYYKPIWPEGMNWCGQRRWFVIHRTLMVLTVLLTAVAFVIIFVHVGKYSEIVGEGFSQAHPIIGICVMALALLNPAVAMCRPHPGTPNRVYFVVFHAAVGQIAHSASIMNIFAGTMLTSVSAPEEVQWVLWAFVAWIVIVFIAVPIYDCQANKGAKQEAYEMKASGSATRSEPQPKNTQCKMVVLLMHILVVVGLSAAVCIMVILEEKHEKHHQEM